MTEDTKSLRTDVGLDEHSSKETHILGKCHKMLKGVESVHYLHGIAIAANLQAPPAAALTPPIQAPTPETNVL